MQEVLISHLVEDNLGYLTGDLVIRESIGQSGGSASLVLYVELVAACGFERVGSGRQQRAVHGEVKGDIRLDDVFLSRDVVDRDEARDGEECHCCEDFSHNILHSTALYFDCCLVGTSLSEVLTEILLLPLTVFLFLGQTYCISRAKLSLADDRCGDTRIYLCFRDSRWSGVEIARGIR